MIRYIPVMMCLLLNSMYVQAADPVYDAQAFLYYRIPLGGSTPADRAHQYGLRLDQSWIDQDQAIDLNRLMSRNAVMDFRMSSNEPAKLEFHGVDYLQKYYASRADEGASEAAEATAGEESPAETAATEPGEQPDEQTEGEPVFTDEIVDSLEDVPFGIYLGLGILGAIVVGG